MKSSKVILAGAVALNGTSMLAYAESIQVKDLSDFGLDQQKVTEIFRYTIGIELNPTEVIKVERDDEGKNYLFETLDRHSIIVPLSAASGPFNKSSAKQGKQINASGK